MGCIPMRSLRPRAQQLRPSSVMSVPSECRLLLLPRGLLVLIAQCLTVEEKLTVLIRLSRGVLPSLDRSAFCHDVLVLSPAAVASLQSQSTRSGVRLFSSVPTLSFMVSLNAGDSHSLSHFAAFLRLSCSGGLHHPFIATRTLSVETIDRTHIDQDMWDTIWEGISSAFPVLRDLTLTFTSPLRRGRLTEVQHDHLLAVRRLASLHSLSLSGLMMSVDTYTALLSSLSVCELNLSGCRLGRISSRNSAVRPLHSAIQCLWQPQLTTRTHLAEPPEAALSLNGGQVQQLTMTYRLSQSTLTLLPSLSSLTLLNLRETQMASELRTGEEYSALCTPDNRPVIPSLRHFWSMQVSDVHPMDVASALVESCHRFLSCYAASLQSLDLVLPQAESTSLLESVLKCTDLRYLCIEQLSIPIVRSSDRRASARPDRRPSAVPRYCPLLNTLHYSNAQWRDEDVLALLDAFPALTDLRLAVPKMSSRVLPSIGRVCRRLQRLTLESCGPFFLTTPLEDIVTEESTVGGIRSEVVFPALQALLLLSRTERQLLRFNALSLSSLIALLHPSPIQYLKIVVGLSADHLHLFIPLLPLRSLQVLVAWDQGRPGLFGFCWRDAPWRRSATWRRRRQLSLVYNTGWREAWQRRCAGVELSLGEMESEVDFQQHFPQSLTIEVT